MLTVFAFAETQWCHLSRSSWVKGQVWDLFSGKKDCTSQNRSEGTCRKWTTLVLPPTSQFSRPTSIQPSISPVKFATSWFMFKLFPFAQCPYSLCVLILTFLVLDYTFIFIIAKYCVEKILYCYCNLLSLSDCFYLKLEERQVLSLSRKWNMPPLQQLNIFNLGQT